MSPSSTASPGRRLDELIKLYVNHQIEVIQRRTRYRLRKAEERAHILRGYAKALDHLDDVITLIRNSESADAARGRPDGAAGHRRDPGDGDPGHAAAPRSPPSSASGSSTSWPRSRRASPTCRRSSPPERQRQIIHDELAEIVEKYGDDRRAQFVANDGDVSMEDLIAGGGRRHHHAHRVRQADEERPLPLAAPRRKGVMGAQLKQDDIVDHFFVGSTHDWILFFTNKGRVYRSKAYELPEANRTARGQHVANILAFQPDEKIAQVMQIKDYGVAPYLALATARGR